MTINKKNLLCRKKVNLHPALEYLKYLCQSGYWRGHGIHSPFVFELVSEIINGKHPFYHFDSIDQYRQELKVSKQTIECQDFGAGQKGKQRKKISSIAKQSAVQPKYGKLLSRLVHFTKPTTILELGTSLGIGSLYLGMARPSGRLITLEGCQCCADMAKKALFKHGCLNSQVVVGDFDHTLPQVLEKMDHLDFVWFDGNHRKEPTLQYFEQCLQKATNNTVFVFDDIHWSEGMSAAWETIIQHPRITVSLDLYQVGIVFFKSECQKQHFRIRW